MGVLGGAINSITNLIQSMKIQPEKLGECCEVVSSRLLGQDYLQRSIARLLILMAKRIDLPQRCITTTKPQWHMALLLPHAIRELKKCSDVKMISEVSCPRYFDIVRWVQRHGYDERLKELVSRVESDEIKRAVSAQLIQLLPTVLRFQNWVALEYPELIQISTFEGPFDQSFVGWCVLSFRCRSIPFDTIVQKVLNAHQPWIQYQVAKEAMIHGVYSVAKELLQPLVECVETESCAHWINALIEIADPTGRDPCTILSACNSFDFQIQYLNLCFEFDQIKNQIKHGCNVVSICGKMDLNRLKQLEQSLVDMNDQFTALYQSSFGCDSQSLDCIQILSFTCVIIRYAFYNLVLHQSTLNEIEIPTGRRYEMSRRLLQQATLCTDMNEFMKHVDKMLFEFPRRFFLSRPVLSVQVGLFQALRSIDQYNIIPSSSEICIRFQYDFVGRIEARISMHQRKELLDRISHVEFQLTLQPSAECLIETTELMENGFVMCPVHVPWKTMSQRGSYRVKIETYLIDTDQKRWKVPQTLEQGIVVY